MEIKLCINGDGRVAVGTGIRPTEYCRPCYAEAHAAEFVEVKVIIPWRDLGIPHDAIAIACAKTGEDIYEGGTAWLDPIDTRIPNLVYDRFVEIVQPKAAKADKAAPAGA